MKKYYKLYLSILITIVFFAMNPILDLYPHSTKSILSFLYNQNRIFVTISVSWCLIELLRILKSFALNKLDITQTDNLRSRSIYTQINLLEKISVFIIVLFAIGFVLLSFDNIRQIGIGIFASAGLAGIIIGLSAQKVVGTLLAGIQIAITEPFRIDDAVVVENEWGWIEEINLTYIVVRTWDKRRLVLPSTYFLEKPFQNWTRTTAAIIGTVFIYTDYTISIPALRDELSRLLDKTNLWDKDVQVLQVTESKESTLEIRILVSAINSPTAFDLRCYIRENMIEFIQQNYPDSLPKTRITVNK